MRKVEGRGGSWLNVLYIRIFYGAWTTLFLSWLWLYPYFIADFNSRQRTKNLGQHSQLIVYKWLMTTSTFILYVLIIQGSISKCDDRFACASCLPSMTVLCTVYYRPCRFLIAPAGRKTAWSGKKHFVAGTKAVCTPFFLVLLSGSIDWFIDDLAISLSWLARQ